MKKIVIIGATGNTGAYLTEDFVTNLPKSFEVFAAGHRETDFFKRYEIDYASVDISRKETLSRLPQLFF